MTAHHNSACGFLVFLLLSLHSSQYVHGARLRAVTPKVTHKFDLYVFAGPDDWTVGANDTMAVVRVNLKKRTSRLKWAVDIGSVGNEPHHMSFNKDRTVLVAGGLLSFAKGLPSLYFFRTSPFHPPELYKNDTPPNCTAADIGIEMRDGGLLFSMMGGPNGGPGGQLVQYDKNMNYVGQFPPDAAEYVNKTGIGFQPHGITISKDKKYIFSSDFVEPISTLPAFGPVRRWGGVRMFSARTHKLLRTYSAPTEGPNAMGAMDVIWVKNRAVVTCTATGKLYCANPRKKVPEVAYDFGDDNAQPQIIVTSSNEKLMYVATYAQDAVYKLDSTDPCRIKYLNKIQLPKGAGPHSLAISPDDSVLMVTDYFVDMKNIGGVLRGSGDMLLRFIDTATMTEIETMRIDFKTAIKPNVVYRPHGMTILEL